MPEEVVPDVALDESSPAGVPDEKGFPPATKLSDMDAEQRANYYKFQLRQTEGKLGRFADYDDLKKFKETAEADRMSEHEKAVKAARDEGFTAAQMGALTRAAEAILRAGLKARGVDDKEIPDIVDAFNASKFIKDGDVETDRIAALAARMAGTASSSGQPQSGWPAMGQGSHTAPNVTPGAAGKAEAARRFAKKPA